MTFSIGYGGLENFLVLLSTDGKGSLDSAYSVL